MSGRPEVPPAIYLGVLEQAQYTINIELMLYKFVTIQSETAYLCGLCLELPVRG
jgi:hypothetical protein